MSEPTPATLALARGVLGGAAAGSPALAAAFERRYAQLQGRLVILIGPMGFAALLSRALHLARVAHPALDAIVQVPATGMADGTGEMRGVHAFAAAHPAGQVEAALTGILVEFGGLLHFFIGEDLALQLLREAWPDMVIPDDTAEHETEAAR